MDSRWSIWLMPNQDDAGVLQPIINSTCEMVESELFYPHLTLFGRVSVDKNPIISFLKKKSIQYLPITVSVLKVEVGDTYWKSLYLQLDKNPSLIKLQDDICSQLISNRDYEFDPHVSLAYRELDIQNFEMNKLSFPESITFSSVALVETSDNISEWKVSENIQ